MNRPNMLDSKYDNLDYREARRQFDRDTMIYEQNKLLEKQLERANNTSKSFSKPITLTEEIIATIFSTIVLGGVAAITCYYTNFSTFSIILAVLIGIVILCTIFDTIGSRIENKRRDAEFRKLMIELEREKNKENRD